MHYSPSLHRAIRFAILRSHHKEERIENGEKLTIEPYSRDGEEEDH